MSEENTEQRNASHMKRHADAVVALRAAYAAYQAWQEDQGDWETFVDWVEDEDPDRVPQQTVLRRDEFDVDEPAEAPATELLDDDGVWVDTGVQASSPPPRR